MAAASLGEARPRRETAAVRRRPRFELCCAVCGYGVVVSIAPDRCPICSAGVWEHSRRRKPRPVPLR